MANIYNSERLLMLVKRWINNRRIKAKDYLEKTSHFVTELKTLTSDLSKEDPLEFNRESIYLIIEEFFKLKPIASN